MEKEFLLKLKNDYGVVFNDLSLLEEAFNHTSYTNEHLELHLHDNERLEFLGDAVLQFLISKYIFDRFSPLAEGQLSMLRSFIVRESSLAEFAKECHFDRYLKLGKGEERTGGRKRPSLLCDLFEAFIGALEQDQGLRATWQFIEQVMIPKIDAGDFMQQQDDKSNLQEVLQAHGSVEISYQEIAKIGPDHARTFVMAVVVNGQELGRGRGTSKKSAEQQAAHNALQKLKTKK